MKILIIGTGLIGASIGLALKALPPQLFSGTVLGYDTKLEELATAFRIGAIDGVLAMEDVLAPNAANIYILATPVLPILDWMERLAPVLGPSQLVTDAGSTKVAITELATRLFNVHGTDGMAARARFLPGHPMAGKESGGAALADANLFQGATWLFTPLSRASESPTEERWRTLVASFGAISRDLDPAQHDEVCAWVSHLPQMLATALAALLQENFPPAEELTPEQSAAALRAALEPDRIHALAPYASPLTTDAIHSLAGRALREMTRLGSSPYSMWRDVALTNTEPIAAALHALEQRLAHIRENLRTPELREEFITANLFRK